MLTIPAVLAVLTGVALAVLKGIGRAAYAPELLAASAVGIAAIVAAMAPLLLTRGARQGGVSQAGLVGTMLHMFVSLALGSAVYLMHLVAGRNAFLYFLLAVYWITLVLLVVSVAKAIRRAPPEQPAAR